MFVAVTLVVMMWSLDPVSDMTLPWRCCVEEVEDTVVSTISKTFWIKFVLLFTVLLPDHSISEALCFYTSRIVFCFRINVYRPLPGAFFSTLFATYV